jgi:hypothetical protein
MAFFQLRQLLAHHGHFARPGHRLGHHAAPGHLAHALAEVADGHALLHHDVAAVGRLLAHDHAEHGGLPCAVRAHEADAVSRERAHRGFEEEDLTTMLLADGV